MKIRIRTHSLAVSTLILASTLLSTPQASAGQCSVTWGNVYQRIDGFGASSAWRTSWTAAQADMFFSTNLGAGLSMCRNHIVPATSTASSATPTTGETSIMLLAQARGALIWSAPWTPYYGFKDTASLNGGNYLGNGANATNLAYASQLANYVAFMKTTYGINLYAISVQNEPDFITTGYESCGWNGEQIHSFVTNLYSAMVAKGVSSTKIIIPESEHWNTTSLFTPTLTDTNAAAMVSIIANHNYDNCPPTGTPATESVGGLSIWETEVSKLSCAGAYDGSITDAMYWAGRIHLFLTSANASAWHYWWLIDGNAGDNEGLTDTSGNPAKRLYVLGQWSRFVRPGYYRIGAANTTASVLTSAFKDPNTSMFAIVAANTNNYSTNQAFTLSGFSAATVTPWITSSNLSLTNQAVVTVNGNSFSYTLPALSVVTFVGQGLSDLAPTDIALSSTSVQEAQPSGTAVGTLSTSDPNAGNTFTYTLVSGTGSTDNGSFSISGSTLQTAATFSYATQSSFSVRVRSTDQSGLYYEKVFTISAVAVPSNITLTSASVLESQPAGTSVGTLGTVDANGSDTFTYTLVSGTGSDDNASFTISGSTLQTAATFSYATQNSFSIRVRTTTGNGTWVEQVFTVSVIAVPTDITLSNASVLEGQPAGTAVGSFGTVDANGSDTFAYTLVAGAGSDDNASFSISGSTLQTAAMFNDLAQSSYSVRIRSTATGSGQWVEKAFSIGVTEVSIPPAVPVNGTPANGNSTQSLTPTLQASAFSDANPVDVQAASEWLVQRAADSFVVYDSGTDATDLTNLTLPAGVLDYATAYTWQVQYQDVRGAWSGYSIATGFQTAGPLLSVIRQPGIVVISWPTNAVGFTLEYATDLKSGNWTPVTPDPSVLIDQNVVTNGIGSNTASFYRLTRTLP
jgi:O-glycosyl hydrolase